MIFIIIINTSRKKTKKKLQTFIRYLIYLLYRRYKLHRCEVIFFPPLIGRNFAEFIKRKHWGLILNLVSSREKYLSEWSSHHRIARLVNIYWLWLLKRRKEIYLSMLNNVIPRNTRKHVSKYRIFSVETWHSWLRTRRPIFPRKIPPSRTFFRAPVPGSKLARVLASDISHSGLWPPLFSLSFFLSRRDN